jgi:uncharacterized protein YqgV (UPF0045/DUF77 family)
VPLRLEFTVEPFVEGRPGAHVKAAIETARRLGFDPEVGPFATAVEGTDGDVLASMGEIAGAAVAAGAYRVTMSLAPKGVPAVRSRRLPSGVIDRLIAAVELELGAKLADLSREDKQRAVKLLDERGAFELRRAAEDVADALGVSRITVYNYLNKL